MIFGSTLPSEPEPLRSGALALSQEGWAGGSAGRPAGSPPADPSPSGHSPHDNERRQQQRAYAFQQTIGAVFSVLARTPATQTMPLGALAGYTFPPIARFQVALAEARVTPANMPEPIAVVLWAKVSAEVDERLAAATEDMLPLNPGEWDSGPICWAVLVAGERNAVREVLTRLAAKFADQGGLRVRQRQQDGRYIVGVV